MVFNLTPERQYQSGTIMYLVGDGLKALLNVFFSTLVYQIQVLSGILMMNGNRISSLIQIKIHVCRYSINFWNKIIMMWRKLFEEQAPYQGGKVQEISSSGVFEFVFNTKLQNYYSCLQFYEVKEEFLKEFIKITIIFHYRINNLLESWFKIIKRSLKIQ